MPTLKRFIIILVFILGLIYAILLGLVYCVQPRFVYVHELIPSDQLNLRVWEE